MVYIGEDPANSMHSTVLDLLLATNSDVIMQTKKEEATWCRFACCKEELGVHLAFPGDRNISELYTGC